MLSLKAAFSSKKILPPLINFSILIQSLLLLGVLLSYIRLGSRHVILPADLARKVPRTHLMTETEWRNLGVQQSPGWIHFMIHDPEPHVLLFRRVDADYKNNVQW